MGNRGKARRRGKRAGIVVFAAIVSTFTLVCAIQILQQVWSPPVVDTDLGCRPGLQALLDAVRRARRAAAAKSGDEREALDRFRSALEPEWRWRPAMKARCQQDKEGRQALELLDRLRYAEEHAVRYEAVDLAHLRRRIQKLELSLLQAK